MQAIFVRPVSAAQVRPLRHAVLRQGKPLMSAAFEGDDAEATLHLAAFAQGGSVGGEIVGGEVEVGESEVGEIVGVASFMRQAMPGREGIPAWRLRGMAVDDRLRGRGVGKRIIDRGVELAREAAAEIVWCNARATAIGFYERMGWAVVGETFEESGLPHVVMWRTTAER